MTRTLLKTLKTSTMNWNVNELLGGLRFGTLFLEKTLKTTPTTTRNWSFNGLREEGWDGWYFHQLFRQLRLANGSSRRDVLERDLGHFDNLFGNHRKKRVSCSTTSGTGASRAGKTRRGDNKLLHGVPLNLLLRPDFGEPVRPRPGLFVKRQIEELRLGSGGIPDRARVVLLALPLLGPGRLQALCAVVRGRSPPVGLPSFEESS